MELKFCTPKHGYYQSFDEASEACSSEAHCKYIDDTKCSQYSTFHLCNEDAEVKESVSSCVHEKQTDYIGNF